MKNILFTIFLLLAFDCLQAEIIKFSTPKISGKISSDNIELTDWQAVLNCHYLLNGKKQFVNNYPATFLKKINENNYELKVKAGNIVEILPNLEIQNCHYKLILIGKLISTRQTLFGEVILLGQENGKMTEKEIEFINNKSLVSKYLQEKSKEIKISTGADGGIVLDE